MRTLAQAEAKTCSLCGIEEGKPPFYAALLLSPMSGRLQCRFVEPCAARAAQRTTEAMRRTERTVIDPKTPRPWRLDGSYGCYFPSSDLNVGQMGGRGTGEPKDVEWLTPNSCPDYPRTEEG